MTRNPSPSELAQRFELEGSSVLSLRDDTTLTGLGLDANTEVTDDAAVTLTLAVTSDSTTSADDGGPRAKMILKRTGADGDTDPTPAFAPIGDIEWHTVHDDGTEYTVARIWVDEESADPTVNVGRMRIGVHNGNATTYGEDTYLYLTGYGDVDLTGGNMAVNARTAFQFNASGSTGTVGFFTGASGSVNFVTPNFYITKYSGFYTIQCKIDVTPLSADRTVSVPDADGTFGVKVSVPASAAAAGEPGMWAADASFLYVCTASSTWKRVAIASW